VPSRFEEVSSTSVGRLGYDVGPQKPCSADWSRFCTVNGRGVDDGLGAGEEGKRCGTNGSFDCQEGRVRAEGEGSEGGENAAYGVRFRAEEKMTPITGEMVQRGSSGGLTWR